MTVIQSLQARRLYLAERSGEGRKIDALLAIVDFGRLATIRLIRGGKASVTRE
jgi:hypothetical protein